MSGLLNKVRLKFILFMAVIIFCKKSEAFDFSSSTYYWQNYLFDGKIYGKDFLATENTISQEIENFTFHTDIFSYNNHLYNEIDFGLGISKSLSQFNIDVGFWYYNGMKLGGNYYEPYFLIYYDTGILKPKITLGYISYNHQFREVFSVDYTHSIEDFSFTITPQIGNTYYDYQYQYFGLTIGLNYEVNKNMTLFSSFEINRTIENAPETTSSISSGISISF